LMPDALAAALNDAVTAYHRLHNQLFGVARSVGIIHEHWQAIKRGAVARLRET
jgi:hypothetical protein